MLKPTLTFALLALPAFPSTIPPGVIGLELRMQFNVGRISFDQQYWMDLVGFVPGDGYWPVEGVPTEDPPPGAIAPIALNFAGMEQVAGPLLVIGARSSATPHTWMQLLEEPALDGPHVPLVLTSAVLTGFLPGKPGFESGAPMVVRLLEGGGMVRFGQGFIQGSLYPLVMELEIQGERSFTFQVRQSSSLYGSWEPTEIPEPSTWALMSLGLLGLLLSARFRRRRTTGVL
jgi:hypothetical protein